MSSQPCPAPPRAPTHPPQEAVKHTQYDRLRDSRGKAPGLLGWWPDKACTFVDNHDTVRRRCAE